MELPEALRLERLALTVQVKQYGMLTEQTSVARAILSALDHIPTVLILSQDAFYRKHTPEEIKLAFQNDLDLGKCRISLDLTQALLTTRKDHPDSIDIALFAKVGDLMAIGYEPGADASSVSQS